MRHGKVTWAGIVWPFTEREPAKAGRFDPGSYTGNVEPPEPPEYDIDWEGAVWSDEWYEFALVLPWDEMPSHLWPRVVPREGEHLTGIFVEHVATTFYDEIAAEIAEL